MTTLGAQQTCSEKGDCVLWECVFADAYTTIKSLTHLCYAPRVKGHWL
jgi:hypothetical protein